VKVKMRLGKEVARSCVLAQGGRAIVLISEKCGARFWFSLWGKCVWVMGRVLGSKLRPGEALALIPSMMYPQGKPRGWEDRTRM